MTRFDRLFLKVFPWLLLGYYLLTIAFGVFLMFYFLIVMFGEQP